MNTTNRSFRPIVLLLAAVILIAAFSGLLTPREHLPRVEYSQVLKFFREQQVTAFSLKDTELTLQLKDPYEKSKTVYCDLGDAEVFHRDLDETIAAQYESGVLSEYDYPPADEPSIWMELLPTILIALLLGLVMLFVLGRMNGGPGGMASFTKAEAQFGAGKTPVTFSDVAGADEEKEELAQIVTRSARLLEVGIDDGGAMEIARRSRGTARIANNLLRRVRDYAQVRAGNHIDEAVADKALEMEGIDRAGLDEMDKRILSCICETFGGGPVGLGTVAVSVGEEAGTIEDVYEPYLIQEGYIARTPRGREATPQAFRALGLHPAARGGQQTLGI